MSGTEAAKVEDGQDRPVPEPKVVAIPTGRRLTAECQLRNLKEAVHPAGRGRTAGWSRGSVHLASDRKAQGAPYLQPPGGKAHSSRSAMKHQLENNQGAVANSTYREAVVEPRPRLEQES